MSSIPNTIAGLLTDLGNSSSESVSGQDKMSLLQSQLSVNLAGLIHNAVTENAAATRLNATELQTSAIKLVSGIEKFTNAFTQASLDLKDASSQSSKVASRLNTFTFVLAFATVLMTAAVCWQAWETKRQADVAERVFKSQEAIRVGTSQTGAPVDPNTLPKKP